MAVIIENGYVTKSAFILTQVDDMVNYVVQNSGRSKTGAIIYGRSSVFIYANSFFIFLALNASGNVTLLREWLLYLIKGIVACYKTEIIIVIIFFYVSHLCIAAHYSQ